MIRLIFPILVKNKQVLRRDFILDCTSEDWNKMIAVDLTGAFHCIQAAARQMIRQGREGRSSTRRIDSIPFPRAISGRILSRKSRTPYAKPGSGARVHSRGHHIKFSMPARCSD
jgi:NAD(P)-dependent dehydrogenase (short-subunit alcohol dehydrogenase family)